MDTVSRQRQSRFSRIFCCRVVWNRIPSVEFDAGKEAEFVAPSDWTSSEGDESDVARDPGKGSPVLGWEPNAFDSKAPLDVISVGQDLDCQGLTGMNC
jgi:hypothetical protein